MVGILVHFLPSQQDFIDDANLSNNSFIMYQSVLCGFHTFFCLEELIAKLEILHHDVDIENKFNTPVFEIHPSDLSITFPKNYLGLYSALAVILADLS